MHEPLIAVDWGTTNRRIYRIAADGTLDRSLESDRGITKITPDMYPGAVIKLRQDFGDHPILMAGMVGSNRGWVEVPYVSCPAGAADIAANILWLDEDYTGIVPGISYAHLDVCDVMRGEEVQILGALATERISATDFVCLPGTHTKWAAIADGKIVALRTAITGELFDLLRNHSILSDLLAQPAIMGAAFYAGLDRALVHDDLTTELFRTRARVLLGRSSAESVASYVSGLLIGSDIRAALHQVDCQRIAVIGAAPLTNLFAAAIKHLGGTAVLIEGGQAFVAGASRLRELMQ